MHRVGVIGLGVMGSRMIGAMADDARFQVRRVWDLDSERAKSLQQQYPAVAIGQSAAALVADGEIDLIYIATPPATHVQYATLAVKHGKAVLCEKPLAVDLQEAAELVRLAEENQTPNAVNFPFASSPAVAAIEQAVAIGGIGDLVGVEMRFHFPRWPRAWQKAGAWLSGREEGGFVREVFSHFAYLTHRVIGPPTLKWSRITYPDDSDLAETYALAELESEGLPVRMFGGVAGAGPDHVEWTLYGTQRSLRFLNWRILQTGSDAGWEERELESSNVNSQLTSLSHMLEAKSHGLPSFRVGLEVQQLVESLLSAGSAPGAPN